MTAPDLDDPSLYPRRDPGGMGMLLEAFPRLCREGWEAAGHFHLPPSYRHISRIAFLGMGGSAIAGEMAASLLRTEEGAPLPILHRDYGLPPGVDEKTLVVLSSYSGETEETLSGLDPALARGAKVLALTHGGRLAQLAGERGFPCYPVPVEASPRATLPFVLTSLLRILAGLGLARERAGEVQEAWELLVRMNGEVGPAAPIPGNGAKSLAQRLRGRVPVIYGAGPLAPVARRWKTQINENAKAWAFAEELPEAHHNSVVGWGLPADLRDRLFVVLLVPSRASPRVLLRLQITLELLKSAAVPYEAVQARGESELAQVLTATLYGDYISYYLALLNGVDPTPLPNVDRIKRRLQEE